MPQIIKPKQVQIVTKDGEVSVHITLDVNLNISGHTITGSDPVAEKKREPEQETEWLIPEFSSSKIKFGKKSS